VDPNDDLERDDRIDQDEVDRLVFPGPAEHPPTHLARPDADLVETEPHDEEATGVVPEPPSLMEPRQGQ
jgi:hypothetical protein